MTPAYYTSLVSDDSQALSQSRPCLNESMVLIALKIQKEELE